MTRRALLNAVILIGGVGLVLETGSCAAARYLSTRGVVYIPGSLEVADEHPVLGWPAESTRGVNPGRDALGARVTPASPDADAESCVALYGDSFTFGSGIAATDTWGAEVARRLGCRVANYGVGAYGTDQAFLRFRHGDDDAPIAVLAHQAENVMRNVNQLRNLIYPHDGPLLKPRFVLDDTGPQRPVLRLIPRPAFTSRELATVVERPGRLLSHEYFVPGGVSGTVRAAPPYTVALIRALGHFRVRATLRGEPSHLAFYNADHPSGALHVTAAILERFAAEAIDRGNAGVVVILPTADDVVYFRDHGQWPYAALVSGRIRHLVDVGSAMVERKGVDAVCEWFQQCEGHPSVAGHRLIGTILDDYLRGAGLIALDR